MTVPSRAIRRLTLAAAMVALAASAAAFTGAPATATPTVVDTTLGSNAWLENLKGEHRQFFDSPAPNGGIMLVHMLNFYDTYNRAFGVPDKDVNAVGTFYGTTTFYGLNDAAWARYRLGEFLDATDPATGKPAIANPWRVQPQVIGLSLPQASIESLQKRGATFIICNNALQIFSGILAQKRGLDGKAVYQDLKASILPGVTLVPGMVVAVEQAQAAGLSYHRQ